MIFDKILLIPLLTSAFLTQPEFLIRTYYLKLTVKFSDENIMPVIPDPVKLPNFLFEHLTPVRLYKTDRWGRETHGIPAHVRERVRFRLVSVLGKKIQKRGRECTHKTVE
jgi:hypothetical protein